MTVSQQTPVSNWWGNNSATEFPFNFYIEKESELLVEHTDLNGVKSTLENGVDYSIHEVGNKEGSYIIFPLAGSRYKTLAWDTSTDKKELLTIALTLPIEQAAEYKDSGDLSKKNLELSFDYVVRLIQILNRTMSRAVKVNEGDEATPEQLIASLNKSKRIALDAASTATSQAENAQNSANIASEKADIATVKAAEVTETYNNAMADIQKDWQDAIDEIEEKQSTAETSITNLQATAESTIANAGAEQVSNIKKTGFYMQDDKLYYINADGEIKEFVSGGGRELLEIYIDPFCDESENKGRIANGQIIVQNQFPEATKKLKKRVGWDSENKKATLNTSLVCTETEWQAIKTASKLGQCGKFVIDDEAGTIRLPAIVNINGLTDLSNAGLIKDESLPNITGTYYGAIGYHNADGALRVGGVASGSNSQATRETTAGYYWNFNASRSSFTYKNNAPVQQEAVQYSYVICVNTGVEEAERPINNYQVNNTNSYGDNKYVGNTILDNLSWLRSVGQENPAGVHQDFFKWAVANIGQPFGAGYITGTKLYGYSVTISSTKWSYRVIKKVPEVGDPVFGYENDAGARLTCGTIESVDTTNNSFTFTDTQQNVSRTVTKDSTSDSAITPYSLQVNTEKQTFILPTLNGEEDILSAKYTDLTLPASDAVSIAPANGYISLVANMNTTNSSCTLVNKTSGMISIRTSTSNGYFSAFLPVQKNDYYFIQYTGLSNVIRHRFIYAKGNGNLYYYVGDTLQNADLINIARLSEQLVDKADKNDIDGNFHNINKNVYNGAGLTTLTTFDISDIIPTEGLYEIYVSASFSTVSSAASYSNLLGTTDYNPHQVFIAGTNNGFTTGGNVILQTNNKKIKFINSIYTGGVISQIISIYGFRRIK